MFDGFFFAGMQKVRGMSMCFDDELDDRLVHDFSDHCSRSEAVETLSWR